MSAGGGKKGLKKVAMHVGPNMTPMVDIVMCILIFFMLGSSFMAAELFLTSNMVVSDKGVASEKKTIDIPPVQIPVHMELQQGGTTRVKAESVHFPGYLTVGRPDLETDNERRKEQQDLNAQIAAQFKAVKDAGLTGEALIVLKPRGDVPYEDVIKVYDACMKARFEKVAFSPATN